MNTRHRPQYHFLPAANWLNDPNGLIQFDGQYHMFYQHNPNNAFWGDMSWGHAVSRDLVHWEHWPVALRPTPDSYDQDGIFSGCAVNDNGTPTLIYTAIRGADRANRTALPAIATSRDGGRTWEKDPANPVIPAPPPDLDLIGFRDHSAWRDGEWWYQVVGAGIRYVGGTALLYRSRDLRAWDYLGPIMVGDREQTQPLWTGSMWECPDLFRVDHRHVLIISVWDIDPVAYVPRERRTHFVAYFTGEFKDHRFNPQLVGQVDYGASFYAPQSFTDDQGRRVMFGWLREMRPVDEYVADGWSGCMSLPRIVSLAEDGTLRQTPAPEVEQLRGAHRSWTDVALADVDPLADVRGDNLEIQAEIDPGGAHEIVLLVRASPDRSEFTRILYDARDNRLRVDTRLGRKDYAGPIYGQPAPFTLAPGEPLRLRAFIDRSVIEVFANDRLCFGERVYPEGDDSIGLSLHAKGGNARANRLDVWELGSIW